MWGDQIKHGLTAQQVISPTFKMIYFSKFLTFHCIVFYYYGMNWNTYHEFLKYSVSKSSVSSFFKYLEIYACINFSVSSQNIFGFLDCLRLKYYLGIYYRM